MPTPRETAQRLANAHRQADDKTTKIQYFPTATSNHVCLLEVSGSAPTTNEVLPFEFPSDPANGIDFKSVVVLLSPNEWEKVKSKELPLPQGWDISTAEEL